MANPGDKLSTAQPETSIGFLLRRAAQQCKDVTVPILKEFGLATHELTTLNIIHTNEACILKTVADGVGVEPPAMHRIMKSLEAKNLVDRRKSAQDSRHTLYELTDTGVAVARKATTQVQRAEDDVLGELSAKERKVLMESLRKLL